MKKVAMIGVGKLGQDCAEVMSQHYDVVGYDISPRTPLFPMMPSIEQAVKDRDIIFIAAPTAHDPVYGGETPTSHLPNKDFDYTVVTDILTEVNKHVNKKLQADFNKYGLINFTFNVLVLAEKNITKQKLLILEQLEIDSVHRMNLYNNKRAIAKLK
jgi:3-hydroxyacyl-CoA dehydrogenase